MQRSAYNSVGGDGGEGGGCRACCFTYTQRLGDLAAAGCQRMSPKTQHGAKQCTICSIVTLVIAIALIVQSFIVPTLLHKDVRDIATGARCRRFDARCDPHSPSWCGLLCLLSAPSLLSW